MARYGLQIAIGTYTGDGNTSQNITGLGFNPGFLMISNGTQAGVNCQSAMAIGTSTQFAGGLALASAQINELFVDGFQVGNDSTVNSNAITYFYIAISGPSSQAYFRNGRYTGTGSSRTFDLDTIGFTPDIFLTKADDTLPMIGKIAAQTILSFHTNASIDRTGEIVSFVPNGVVLGNQDNANKVDKYFYYSAFKHLSGAINSGTFTGTGANNSITGIGFQPDLLLIKNGNDSTAGLIWRTKDMPAGYAAYLVGGTPPATGLINSFDSDGFTVGSNDAVNKSGDPIYWIAFKAGNFFPGLTRTAVSE